MNPLHNLLEIPAVHNIVQKIASIGRKKCRIAIEKFLIENARGRILEVAGGTNRYNYLFTDNFFVYGDINHEYVNLAKKRNPELKAVVFDGRYIPFKKGSFDVVMSVGFYHHINDEDTKKGIEECLRVININGKLAFIDAFYPENSNDFIGNFLARNDRGRFMRKLEYFLKMIEEKDRLIEWKLIDGSYPWNNIGFVIKKT